MDGLVGAFLPTEGAELVAVCSAGGRVGRIRTLTTTRFGLHGGGRGAVDVDIRSRLIGIGVVT